MKRPLGLARNLQLGGAVLLVIVYLQEVFLTFSVMSWSRADSGKWQVLVELQKVNPLWSGLALLLVMLGFLLFMVGYLMKRRRREYPVGGKKASRLNAYHLFLSYGWVGLLFFGGVFLYYLGGAALIPDWLRTSVGGSAIGGVSMQLTAMLAIPLFFRKALPEIGLTRPILTWKMLGYVLMFFVMTYAMSLVAGSVGEWLGVETDSYREKHISDELHGALQGGLLMTLMPILATAVIAPIGEELIFRGVLMSVLTARFGVYVGVLGSAFIFALIHADPILFLPIMGMGILFGTLYRITGSLWAAIWLHMLNNLFASLMDLV